MTRSYLLTVSLALVFLIGHPPRGSSEEPAVDLAGYHAECGIAVRRDGERLTVDWPMEQDESGRLVLDLRPGQPLIRSMGITAGGGENVRLLLEEIDPETFLLVGSRQAPADRPPGMSVFNVFFDSPAKRPYQAYRSRLDLKGVRVTSRGCRATVTLGEVAIGPFAGELRLTFYRGARLVHIETVVHTDRDRRAILHDAGLAFSAPSKTRFAWIDTEGKLHREQPAADTLDRNMAVRHRMLIAETGSGSVACFPSPHQYFSPRDLTDNLSTVWFGRRHRGLDDRFGFGIRQSEQGGGSWVPWFNAPPGTDQHLGFSTSCPREMPSGPWSRPSGTLTAIDSRSYPAITR